MPPKPVSRYYNFGLTFRWMRGDSFVVVKRGYVIEGKAVVVVRDSTTPKVQDRPHEDIGNDRHTWLAWFPINPSGWVVPNALARAAAEWARSHPNVADWRDQPRLSKTALSTG